jgi:hypothetical protein
MTIWVRTLAGNLIGGPAHSHFQNLKITYYYQIKLLILIVYAKEGGPWVKLPSSVCP